MLINLPYLKLVKHITLYFNILVNLFIYLFIYYYIFFYFDSFGLSNNLNWFINF